MLFHKFVIFPIFTNYSTFHALFPSLEYDYKRISTFRHSCAFRRIMLPGKPPSFHCHGPCLSSCNFAKIPPFYELCKNVSNKID